MDIAASEFVAVTKFRFRSPVRDAEGAGGSLLHVVVAPDTRAISAIGVRFGLVGREVFMPVSQVEEATQDLVQLRVTQAEAAKGAQSAPAGSVRLGRHTAVTLDGKRLGRLAQVTFNRDTGALRHLVIDRLGGEVVASALAISRLDANGVALASLGAGAAPVATPYRPDAELREDVIHALDQYPRMRVDLGGITVSAIDGVVWLRGHVSSDLNCRLAEDLAREVHGVAELHNQLISDNDLAAAVSRALARDPRTAEEHIGVYPVLGRVRLRGAVRTPIAHDAAAEIATTVPSAGEIINELHVNADANVLPVMASVTNTEDVVPGGR